MVDSVASLDDYLIITPTTGDVKAKINGTVFNITIDQRIFLNPLNFINVTTGQFFNDTNLIYSSFQGNFNSNISARLPLENQTIVHCSNVTGSTSNLCTITSGTGGDFFFANFTVSFNNNLSSALPLENRTISHISNITGFFFNYNETAVLISQYGANWYNHSSALTTQFGKFWYNMSIAVNPFNQILNTTSNVSFESVNATREVYVGNTAVKQWLYNQTLSVFLMQLLNNTIANYGNRVGFNSTFNNTYKNLLGQQCPLGQIVNGTFINGTFTCTTDQTGESGGNPFNQNLNTTSNVTFNNITATGKISGDG